MVSMIQEVQHSEAKKKKGNERYNDYKSRNKIGIFH
jgi:hypothetical protein